MTAMIAAGSLAVGTLTGVVIAVAYLHRTFALRDDVDGIEDRVEEHMRYLRTRVDAMVDRLAK